MVMLEDLRAFLRARLIEDEQIARAALPGPWEAAYHYDAMGDVDPDWTVVALHTAPATAESTGEDPAHIARWNPARVLAEVEAKQTILQDSAGWPHLGAADLEYTYALEDVLRCLAMPYAAHPDYYRDEWKR